ncbi:MAG: hypothetical protein ACU0BF_04055 [Paracoccaceae bacterium]
MDPRPLAAAGFLTAGLMLAAAPAHPQAAPPRPPACAPHAAVMAHLAERYGEARRSLGLTANAQILEVYANDETGSWTITVTRPGGPTCLIASGQHWQDAPPALTPAGDPA